MMGRQVILPSAPQRIISLVPSQTELLYDLGLEDRIAGQTIFCVHPREKFSRATKVGGTKKVRYETIAGLNPDLIVCNKEENTEEIVNILAASYPVWVSDIKTVDDALTMIEQLGRVFDVSERAHALAENIKKSFEKPFPGKVYDCLYLIWKDPYMAAGRDTFIDQMLASAGFLNLLPAGSRYPELSADEIAGLKPEFILLSSEPYPFKEKHMAELAQISPGTRIALVDGEFFSWYGSRLLNSRNYFRELRQSLNID